MPSKWFDFQITFSEIFKLAETLPLIVRVSVSYKAGSMGYPSYETEDLIIPY